MLTNFPYYLTIQNKESTMKKAVWIALGAAGMLYAGANPALQNYMEELAAEAGIKGFSPARGETIFHAKNRGGKTASCTGCHTAELTKAGENAKTGKRIDPLAPSVNPKSLTDLKNVKKWLRRNFRDVYGREGTAHEKGDVLTYILSK